MCLHIKLCSPPIDNIWAMVIVWRLRGNIIRTAPCWVVWHNVHSQQHTHVNSSYRSSRLGLSHWDPYAMHRGGCLSCIIVTWWSGAGGIQALAARPTGFHQCFDTVGLVIWPVKIVPDMTYNVFGGTLNLAQSIVDHLSSHVHWLCCYHVWLPVAKGDWTKMKGKTTLREIFRIILQCFCRPSASLKLYNTTTNRVDDVTRWMRSNMLQMNCKDQDHGVLTIVVLKRSLSHHFQLAQMKSFWLPSFVTSLSTLTSEVGLTSWRPSLSVDYFIFTDNNEMFCSEQTTLWSGYHRVLEWSD